MNSSQTRYTCPKLDTSRIYVLGFGSEEEVQPPLFSLQSFLRPAPNAVLNTYPSGNYPHQRVRRGLYPETFSHIPTPQENTSIQHKADTTKQLYSLQKDVYSKPERNRPKRRNGVNHPDNPNRRGQPGHAEMCLWSTTERKCACLLRFLCRLMHLLIFASLDSSLMSPLPSKVCVNGVQFNWGLGGGGWGGGWRMSV